MFQRDGKIAYKKDLDNTLALCKHLDYPQKKFKSVHIAGTNGKGSCAHMLASIFQEAGYKCGLYTSPHLKDFRERIKINGQMISEQSVMDFVEAHKANFEEIKPSFFEWTVALAFDEFAKQKVDIAIVETGMGGRLDSTNVLLPELSVITNIALDHTQYLGKDLQTIASEKAGIIKKDVPLIIGEKGKLELFFRDKAMEKGSGIYFAEEFHLPKNLTSGLMGIYQKKNLKTVYASWIILKDLGWDLEKTHLFEGCKKVVENTGLRGRWEVLQNKPLIVADTAHNEAGIKQVMKQISKTNFKKLHIVFGLVSDKDSTAILKLMPKDAKYYFCAANIARALPVDVLMELANEYKLQGNTYTSVKEAFKASQKDAERSDMIYIGGSTFVVAEIL